VFLVNGAMECVWVMFPPLFGFHSGLVPNQERNQPGPFAPSFDICAPTKNSFCERSNCAYNERQPVAICQ
jgi:hypothetical protein